MTPSKEKDNPQVPLENSSSKDSTKEPTTESLEEKVGMDEVERAAKAAKVARQLANIKKMKSAYSSSTTLDLAQLTQDSDLRSKEPLVDTSNEEE